jgi:hypothetical protein
MPRFLLVLVLAALPLSAAPPPAPAPAAAPKPFHLTLEANPAAPFPFLSKFGKTTLHVYRSGVRAETLWLNAFSRNGAASMTVENPLGRMYTDVPIAQVPSILGKLASYKDDFGVHAKLEAPASGRLANLDARRYRIVYGPSAWIDVWTTTALPDNAALRSIVTEFTRGISPATAALVKQIPGLPLQVVMNFSHHPLVTVLKVQSLSQNAADEESALSVGKLYFRAPLLDALWK